MAEDITQPGFSMRKFEGLRPPAVPSLKFASAAAAGSRHLKPDRGTKPHCLHHCATGGQGRIDRQLSSRSAHGHTSPGLWVLAAEGVSPIRGRLRSVLCASVTCPSPRLADKPVCAAAAHCFNADAAKTPATFSITCWGGHHDLIADRSEHGATDSTCHRQSR